MYMPTWTEKQRISPRIPSIFGLESIKKSVYVLPMSLQRRQPGLGQLFWHSWAVMLYNMAMLA